MNDEIEAKLAALRDAPAPMPRDLRARILADAGRVSRPTPARGPRWALWSGLAGLPAAGLLGLWIGISQPAMVWQSVPGLTVSDSVLDEVFGGALLSEEAA